MARKIEEPDYARTQLLAKGLEGLAHAPELRIAQERDGKAHRLERARHIRGIVHGIR
jgi:hypothetical protein